MNNKINIKSSGRVESLRRLVAADCPRQAHYLAWQVWGVETLGTREWELREEGLHYATVDADSAEDALEQARDGVDPSTYSTDDTVWIDVSVRCPLTGETADATVTLEPEEPECEGSTHDWRDVSVRASGGGVVCTDVCAHCGTRRTTDTWAQRADTGEQGLVSVSYAAREDGR